MGRGIATGSSDFKEIIDKGALYIDKTLFIKEILDNYSKILLITRPRRFGKTLNMQMLRTFLDIAKKEDAYLFDGLKIIGEGEKYTSKQNTYPVIFLSMNAISCNDYDSLIDAMKIKVQSIYQEHRYLLDSPNIYPEDIVAINDILTKKENEEDLKDSLLNLTELMYKHYGKKPYY